MLRTFTRLVTLALSLGAVACADTTPSESVDTEGALGTRASCIDSEPTRDPNEAAPDTGVRLTSHYRDINGTCLHYVEAGDPNAPLVVLVHGIPQHWYAWRKIIGPLVNAGYRVVAPDQRGFNESARPDPKNKSNYSIKTLAADIDGLIEALLPGNDENGKPRQAIVVGHDYGGIAAMGAGMYYPARLKKLVVLDDPHPALWRKFLLEERDDEQFAMSWYVFAFASAKLIVDPYFKGKIFGLGGGIRGQLDHYFVSDPKVSVRTPGTVTDRDIDVYARSFTDHGSDLRPLYAYYEALFEEGQPLFTNRNTLWLAAVSGQSYFGREMLGVAVPQFIAGREKLDAPHFPTIRVPTYVAFGSEDGFVRASLYANDRELAPYISDLRTKIFDGASHWVTEERPQEVIDLVLGFARE